MQQTDPCQRAAVRDINLCRARHDSAIVDTFHGQHVTVRDCPECGHRSRRFEAYMYITAPIPGSDTAARNFMIVPVGGFSKAKKACVRLKNSDTVGAFLVAAAAIAGVSAEDAPRRLCAAIWTPGKATETQFLEKLDEVLPAQKSSWLQCDTTPRALLQRWCPRARCATACEQTTARTLQVMR